MDAQEFKRDIREHLDSAKSELQYLKYRQIYLSTTSVPKTTHDMIKDRIAAKEREIKKLETFLTT